MAETTYDFDKIIAENSPVIQHFDTN